MKQINIRSVGEEFDNILKQLSPKQLEKALRRGYSHTAGRARKVAVEHLRSSGLSVRGNQGDWAKGIRSYVYDNGWGFMLTVKPRKAKKAGGKGEKGMHVNRYGKTKPILMWAEDGTQKRKRGGRRLRTGSGKNRRVYAVMGGKSTGAMPAYHFMQKADAPARKLVYQYTNKDVEDALTKAAKKAGF